MIRRALTPTALPWARPRHERLLLVLVALAALSPMHWGSTQDASHFCLSRSIAAGTFDVGQCAQNQIDIAFYGGHIYSNKAPGMSLLSVPAVEAVQLPTASAWKLDGDTRLWLVRILTAGVAFVCCAFLVGRVAEGLAPGAGGATLVAFGLGTLVAPFAAAGFDHVPTAAFAFGGFVAAWARRPALAGVLAGLAYACEYEAASALLLLGLYVALRGRRPLARYVLGAVPGVLWTCIYSWIAFDRPWRIPQHYDLYSFAGVLPGGLLGVHAPTWHAARTVFIGDRGLLVTMPVLVAAAAGLILLWRAGRRAEVLVCAVLTAAFVVGECGYGDPYGGTSPGPRYLVPMLPFLAIGLAPAFARWRWPTAALSVASIVAMTTLTLSWSRGGGSHYRQTVWGELVRLLAHGDSSWLHGQLAQNALHFVGVTRLAAAGAVLACSLVAYGIALRPR